ncbi:T9SS type A sorting domain-containing protein [Ferruginibacter sp. HRS2-29]|uniref:T9SS type A sorting domain-containing protein n=1 Tax=Ferruginibacter sp. HRS2-29 TaxID=2487334 RepID=UPI0020CB99CB|nr:T9SS type A sorting domain-containing protein [Ferruginibacter sp. HRS2-29]MCP9751972.1 T9SS C-terminal target domain-containing protein [Ferruginibacter sp. HRS2-29]
MKSFFKNTRYSLKVAIVGVMLAASLAGVAQIKPVIQDPKLGRIVITDVAGYDLDENFLQPDQVIRLKVPVASSNHGKPTPAGSAKIKISLGSKLALDPSFDLNATELSNYFKWTAYTNGGQTMLVGDLVNPLPANFAEVNVAFKIKGTAQGKSTITANFLITNHNTLSTLSDEDGSNNAAFLKYTVGNVAAPGAITTLLDAKRAGCSVNVTFGINREINISGYEVEVSKDGTAYEKVSTVAAGNQNAYNSTFVISRNLQSKVLYVRIKTVYRSGETKYTQAKTIDGNCDGSWTLGVYPNPASSVKFVTIRATNGEFAGKYKFITVDMAGKIIGTREATLNNVPSYRYELSNLSAGKYLIKVVNLDGSQSAVLSLEKL